MADSISEMMADFARAAVEIARDFPAENVAALDYSEGSLERLEQILSQLHGELRGKGNGAPDDDQITDLCKLWGAYFGEVVRQRWGGEWALETYPGAQFATPTLNVRGSKLFPCMKIYRRLTVGNDDDIAAFYKRVREKLESTPGGKTQ